MGRQEEQPKIINLSELLPEGRSYFYNKEGGELNESLKDLLGPRNYELKFHLKPIGNAFELTGHLKTSLDLVCSRCAFEFNQGIDQDIKEILIIQDELPRNGKTKRQGHSSQWEEDGPFCNELLSEHFDVGAYAHEIIALAEPVRPLGTKNCDDTCENYQQAKKAGWLSDDTESDPKQSPFAVLEQLSPAQKNH